MERYAIIIRPNEEMALLHCYPGDSLDLKTLQETVEGHIETVPTALAGEWSHEQGVGLTLIINEEGKLLGMPVNRLATDMAYLFNDVIVGNAMHRRRQRQRPARQRAPRPQRKPPRRAR